MTDQTRVEKLLLYASRMLNSTLEYEELMGLILGLTLEATDCQAAMVYRIDRHVDTIRARYLRAGEEKFKYFHIPKGVGVIGWVAENREPVIVGDVQNDPRFYREFESLVDISFKSVLVVPLIGRGQTIGVLEAINKNNSEFSAIDLDTLVGLANQFAVAIDNANLYRDAYRESKERELLYDVGKKLSSTLNIDEVLKLILDSLQQVVGFNAGGVYLIDDKRDELDTVYSEGYGNQADTFVHLKYGQGLVGWVATSGEAEIVSDVSADDRYVSARPETRSEIVTPMKIDGRVIGVMNLESDRPAAYDEKSLELLEAFASQAAISVERARLHETMLANQRLEEQLTIAREIQLTFLPKKNPVMAGYDISGVNIPSGEVGGDYFDFIKIIDNQTGISIADVSGKGIPASLIMAAFRASLIAEIRNNFSIRTICSKVNRLIYESVERGNYVTAFYGVLDSRNDIFTFSNCGHNQPIHLKSNDEVCFLKEGGLALGIVEDTEYEERPIFIQSGDLILFYTDGVTESVDSDGNQFGEERLIEILKENRKLSAGDINRALYNRIKSFASPTHVFDDLTMIVMKKL